MFTLTAPGGGPTGSAASAEILLSRMTALGVAVFHFGLHMLLPLFSW